MNKLKVNYLTREEELRLAAKAKVGDIDARNKIIEGIVPLVMRVAIKVCKPGIEPDDLFQMAIQHIIEKFHLYKAERGRASSYFIARLKAQMHRWMNTDGIIRRTVYGEMGDIQGVVSMSWEPLNGEYANCPLSKVLGMEPSELPLELEEMKACLKRLPRGLLRVLILRSNGLSLAECGERLGVTKEAVRQRERTALNNMRGWMDLPLRGRIRKRWGKKSHLLQNVG